MQNDDWSTWWAQKSEGSTIETSHAYTSYACTGFAVAACATHETMKVLVTSCAPTRTSTTSTRIVSRICAVSGGAASVCTLTSIACDLTDAPISLTARIVIVLYSVVCVSPPTVAVQPPTHASASGMSYTTAPPIDISSTLYPDTGYLRPTAIAGIAQLISNDVDVTESATRLGLSGCGGRSTCELTTVVSSDHSPAPSELRARERSLYVRSPRRLMSTNWACTSACTTTGSPVQPSTGDPASQWTS